MKKFLLAFLVCASSLSFAQVGAIGTFSATPNGSNYDYTLSLFNSGTSAIGRLWFGWIPGQDYMPSLPTAISQPSGWNNFVTGFGTSTDGYAIQYTASSAANDLAAGSTATFNFTSAVTPSQMAGNSPYFLNPPMTTSYVYDGNLGAFKVITFAAVPEPATFIGLVPIAGFLIARRKKR